MSDKNAGFNIMLKKVPLRYSMSPKSHFIPFNPGSHTYVTYTRCAREIYTPEIYTKFIKKIVDQNSMLNVLTFAKY